MVSLWRVCRRCESLEGRERSFCSSISLEQRTRTAYLQSSQLQELLQYTVGKSVGQGVTWQRLGPHVRTASWQGWTSSVQASRQGPDAQVICRPLQDCSSLHATVHE